MTEEELRNTLWCDPTRCHNKHSVKTAWDDQVTHECNTCGASFFFGTSLEAWSVMRRANPKQKEHSK